jgi:hypothetical protein
MEDQNQPRPYLLKKIDFDSVRIEKQRIATLYGLTAGIVFSLVSWGYDAFLASRAHAIDPFLAFAMGLVICTLVGGAAGYITYRFNHFFAAFVSWLVAGLIFAWLSGHVTFDLLERALTIVNPGIASLVSYPISAGLQGQLFYVRIAVIGLSVIAGLLEITFADSSANASGPVGRILPAFAWVALFLLAGMATENNLTSHLRSPLTSLDATIQYAIPRLSTDLNHPADKRFRTGALIDIRDDLSQPYQLILKGYDVYLYETTVIIRFPASWALCTISSDQPVTCHPTTATELAHPQ